MDRAFAVHVHHLGARTEPLRCEFEDATIVAVDTHGRLRVELTTVIAERPTSLLVALRHSGSGVTTEWSAGVSCPGLTHLTPPTPPTHEHGEGGREVRWVCEMATSLHHEASRHASRTPHSGGVWPFAGGAMTGHATLHIVVQVTRDPWAPWAEYEYGFPSFRISKVEPFLGAVTYDDFTASATFRTIVRRGLFQPLCTSSGVSGGVGVAEGGGAGVRDAVELMEARARLVTTIPPTGPHPTGPHPTKGFSFRGERKRGPQMGSQMTVTTADGWTFVVPHAALGKNCDMPLPTGRLHVDAGAGLVAAVLWIAIAVECLGPIFEAWDPTHAKELVGVAMALGSLGASRLLARACQGAKEPKVRAAVGRHLVGIFEDSGQSGLP